MLFPKGWRRATALVLRASSGDGSDSHGEAERGVLFRDKLLKGTLDRGGLCHLLLDTPEGPAVGC